MMFHLQSGWREPSDEQPDVDVVATNVARRPDTRIFWSPPVAFAGRSTEGVSSASGTQKERLYSRDTVLSGNQAGMSTKPPSLKSDPRGTLPSSRRGKSRLCYGQRNNNQPSLKSCAPLPRQQDVQNTLNVI